MGAFDVALLNKKEHMALCICCAMVSALESWDIQSTGDYSPEEDTRMEVIASKGVLLAEEIIKRCD